MGREETPEACAAAASAALDRVCFSGAAVAGLAAVLERAGGFEEAEANPVALYSQRCASASPKARKP